MTEIVDQTNQQLMTFMTKVSFGFSMDSYDVSIQQQSLLDTLAYLIKGSVPQVTHVTIECLRVAHELDV